MVRLVEGLRLGPVVFVMRNRFLCAVALVLGCPLGAHATDADGAGVTQAVADFPVREEGGTRKAVGPHTDLLPYLIN